MCWETTFDFKISSIWISPQSKKSLFINNTKSLMTQGFPGGAVLKNLPAKQETEVPSLGW